MIGLAPLALIALQTGAPLAVGDPAPPFAVERWLRGAAVELDTGELAGGALARGRVYVVEFWATWCGPCVAGMPHLSELQCAYPDDVRVIGVAPRPDEWGHDEASIAALLAEKGDALAYSIALDAPGPSATGYQNVFRGRTIEGWMGAARVPAIPIAFVVDRAGRIAAIDAPQAIDATVAACVAGTFALEPAARAYRARLEAREHLDDLRARWGAGERDAAEAAALLDGALGTDARLTMTLADLVLGGTPDAECVEVGRRAARRADELTGHGDPSSLSVRARAELLAGDLVAADAAAARAAALAEGPFRAVLEKDYAAQRARHAPAPARPELAAALDELVRAYADAGEFSGAVLVARGDELLLRAAYGWADAERGLANTPETRFHLASLTKTFTGAAVVALAQQGKLALGDPLACFLPDYPRGGEITLEHLLLHRAGIPEPRELPGFAELVRGPVSAATLVEFNRSQPLLFAPGSQHRYSNAGYTLLARVIELASGEGYDAFLSRALLAPLGLAATGPAPLAAEAPARALGHDPGPGDRGMRPVPAKDWAFTVGAGHLESSVDDLRRWLGALNARAPVDVFAPPYPYGWGVRDHFGHASIEQTGLHDGFATALALYPDDGLCVITLSNLTAARGWNELHLGLAALALEQPFEWPELAPAVALDRAAAARLVGRYRHPRGFELELVLGGAGLELGLGSADARRHLDALGGARFRDRLEGIELVFAPGPGPAASVEWRQGEHVDTCPRVAER